MIPLRDSTTLSLLYHLNSEPWPNREAYENTAYMVEYKEIAEAEETISLPPPEDSPLMQLLTRRSSCRRYLTREMPLRAVSTLLGGMYGITKMTRISERQSALLRTAPSAGGLFPLEIYALVRGVEGLADGVHHYASHKHCLELMRRGSHFQEQEDFLVEAPFVQDANMLVLIGAAFDRTQKKYGPRGYRYVLLEAGHAAQNLCLLATHEGLGSLCIGGFFDAKLNRFLGLDGRHEAVVYCVAIGYPDQSAGPEAEMVLSHIQV
jgi:SagB-type dehydrogenase family enzyme